MVHMIAFAGKNKIYIPSAKQKYNEAWIHQNML